MILDLSAVTDGLIALVEETWDSAPIWDELGGPHPGTPTFTPAFTGLAPDAIRDREGPQLSIFLYHVESDNAQEARFWSPQMLAGPGQPVSYLPFALNLFYLVSAYSTSEKGYAEEQQAMSIALRIFHANATVRGDSSPAPAWQLTLTMEHRSYDELSRLWQATTVPLRLGVVYRAAVLFLTPDEPPAGATDVKTLNTMLVNGADFATQLEHEPLHEADVVTQTEAEPEPKAPSEP